MKFARIFAILLSVLTVLLIYQNNALARPADRSVQPSNTEFDNATVVDALAPLPTAAEPDDPNDPTKDPTPPPPRPDPDYPPDEPDQPRAG